MEGEDITQAQPAQQGGQSQGPAETVTRGVGERISPCLLQLLRQRRQIEQAFRGY
jgi:hypothetical protein